MNKSYQEISNKVNELLQNLNINKPAIPLNKVAKSLGLAIITYDFGKTVSGALFVENGKAFIGINPDEPIVRRRFTIAHELGHFILHHKNSNSFFVDEKNFQILFREVKTSSGVLMEKEANVFAANLLMPKFMIAHSLNKINATNVLTDDDIIKKLAKEYNVSQVAMSYRLLNLGYINI